LARAYARALEQLAVAREAEGDWRGAAEWWRRLARHDPFSSRVALRTMQALEAGGERAAAIRHAAAHAALMRAEMEAEPDAAVEQLARRLREASSAPDHAPAVAVLPPAPAPPVPTAAPVAKPAPESAPASLSRRRHWLAPLAGGAAMLLMTALGLVASRQRANAEGVVDSVYIVLPFAQRGPAAVTPDQAELLLHDALSRWTDLQLVDPQRARDLLARNGVPVNLRQARAIAREAGAGKLVWGEITPLGDSIVVRAALYDLIHRGNLVQSGTIRVGRDLRGVSASFGSLAWRLLGRTGDASAGATGTTSLAAWQAYQRGRLAMSTWELERAGAELERAVRLDPGYAAAHLWLAQSRAWRDLSDEAQWRPNAASALADSAELSARERLLASALMALAEQRYPDACARYERLIARDSSDFSAWFGLGECTGADKAVVPDPSSSSGWRFRGSYHRAVQAYSRALRTVPSSHLAFRGAGFARLTNLLRTNERTLREGFAGRGAEARRFLAYPSLEGDTLAFVPWPQEAVHAILKETVPAHDREAGQRNREVLRDVTAEWVRAYPQSPEARAALALALEAQGQFRAARGQPSALGELAQARALARDGDQRLRLAVLQVRLWVRTGEFARARAAADSALRQWRNPSPHQAGALAPLAVLTGRLELARALLRTAAPEATFRTLSRPSVKVPAPLVPPARDALLFGALAVEPEAGEAEAELLRLVDALVEPAERAVVRSALLNPVRRQSFHRGSLARVRAAPLEEAGWLVQVQQALARGDTAAARARLASLTEGRGRRFPGDLTLDYVPAEAEVWLALGDTAQAVRELDRSLLALEVVPEKVLDRVEETLGLLRAMRLRMELAAASGDAATAARWRGALSTLWAGGDARLRRMLR
ncbi:MAG TPA: bacterial transcriptional activator domain-containing protein, partial [Longimicrobium sp.]|nr:bacterial transcriptional activator domain-containing protein [Longimicrobium sp.]